MIKYNENNLLTFKFKSMKSVKNQTIRQILTNYYVNCSLLLVPALYMFFIFTMSEGKNHYIVGIEIIVTFLLYLLFHAGTYKTYVKKHYIDKLRLQVVISNLAFQVIIFFLVKKIILVPAFGAISWMVALICGLILILLFIIVQIRAFQRPFLWSTREAFSGSYLYETLTGIAIMIFIIFLISQFYLLWGTLFIFAPIVTGSIMLVTLNKNGIVHHENQSQVNLYLVALLLWAVGAVSLMYQFFNTQILGVKIGNIIIICASISVFIILFILKNKKNEEVKNAV